MDFNMAPNACFICPVPVYQPPLMLSIAMTFVLQPCSFLSPYFLPILLSPQVHAQATGSSWISVPFSLQLSINLYISGKLHFLMGALEELLD